MFLVKGGGKAISGFPFLLLCVGGLVEVTVRVLFVRSAAGVPTVPAAPVPRKARSLGHRRGVPLIPAVFRGSKREEQLTKVGGGWTQTQQSTNGKPWELFPAVISFVGEEG